MSNSRLHIVPSALLLLASAALAPAIPGQASGQDRGEPAARGQKHCTECGKPLATGVRFCHECGTRVAGAAAPERNDLERFASEDGRVQLWKPRGWNVRAGEEQGCYLVHVQAPDERAGVLMMSLPIGDGRIRDSVTLASVLVEGIKKELPSLEIGRICSNQQTTRTCAEVRYTEDGVRFRGMFYFFLAQGAGTFLGFSADESRYEELRPTLVNVIANLAYAPGGVGSVERHCREASEQGAAPAARSGRPGSPLAMLSAAKAAPLPQGQLVPARAQDGSMQMLLPRGWNLSTNGGMYMALSDAQRTHGISVGWRNVMLPDQNGLGLDQAAAAVGQKVAPMLPPAQAFAWLLESDRIGTQMQVLSGNAMSDLGESAAEASRMAAQYGSRVDMQVLYVEFTLLATGRRTRGIFLVECMYPTMGTVWTLKVSGHWAPAERYEQLLPMFVRMSDSYAMDGAWAQGRLAQQQGDLRQSQQNMFQSINDLGRQYERNNASWWESQRSLDYISAMRSQTTLGQGTWIAQHQGGEIIDTSSWGLQDEQGRRAVGQPWNTTNFQGRSPFTGEQLDEVNSRAAWERLQRMRQ